MRVSIDHKEVKTGLIRKTVHYVVECKVDFSEEEKQIIKQRKLEKWKVMDRELDTMAHDPKNPQSLASPTQT